MTHPFPILFLSGLTAWAANHTNILGWDDTTNPAGTRYKVLSGPASGLYIYTNDAGFDKTQQVIWTIGTTSYYNVLAYNDHGQSTTNGEIRLPQLPLNQTNYERFLVQSASNLNGPWSNYYTGPEYRPGPGPVFFRCVLSNYWR